MGTAVGRSLGKRSVTDERLNIVSDMEHRSPGDDLARQIARNEVDNNNRHQQIKKIKWSDYQIQITIGYRLGVI